MATSNYLNMNPMQQQPGKDITPQLDDTPYGGLPKSPGYQPGWNPSMGTGGGMQSQLSGVNPDYAAVDAFRQQAMRTGPSAWAGLANNNQSLLSTQARDQAAQTSAGQVAGARDAMASHGGMTNGASQQLAMQGQKNYMGMSQDINRQDSINKMQIGMNDETNRIQQMGMLPGMEAQTDNVQFQKSGLQNQADQFDVSQMTGESKNQNAFNLGQNAIASQAWGSGKTAQEQKKVGSCWLITGLSRYVKLPSDEPELLQALKAYMGEAHPKQALFYLRRCGKLVEKMDENKADWTALEGFNTCLVELLRAGEVESAYVLFMTKVGSLLEAYWPECFDKSAIARGLLTRRDKALRAMHAVVPKEGFDAPCLHNIAPEAFFLA